MAQVMNADLTKMIREGALADQTRQDLIARLTERLDAIDLYDHDTDERRELAYAVEDALTALAELSRALEAVEGEDA